jgi:Protein of unknown function (DUF2877)
MKFGTVLQAISFHRDIAQAGEPLTVLAVFRGSLHLELPRGRVGTLTTATRNGPLTVRVRSALWNDSWIGRRVALSYLRYPGFVPSFQKNLAVLDSGDYVVDMSRALPWEPDRTSVDCHLKVLKVQSKQLRELARRSAILADDRLGQALRESRALALKAMRSHDIDGLTVHAGRLLGLGPGLTPAGDDWLCGMAIGLYHLTLGDHNARRSASDLLASFSEAVRVANTTALSQTLLAYAVEGVGDAGLTTLARGLGMPCPELTRRACELDGVGHTSGCDMMLGVADAARFVAERSAVHDIAHTSGVAVSGAGTTDIRVGRGVGAAH